MNVGWGASNVTRTPPGSQPSTVNVMADVVASFPPPALISGGRPNLDASVARLGVDIGRLLVLIQATPSRRLVSPPARAMLMKRGQFVGGHHDLPAGGHE
jgi:hypothetical protein